MKNFLIASSLASVLASGAVRAHGDDHGMPPADETPKAEGHAHGHDHASGHDHAAKKPKPKAAKPHSHGDGKPHVHGAAVADEATLKANAAAAVAKLVDGDKKLDATWKGLAPTSVDTKVYTKGKKKVTQKVVVFEHPTEKSDDGQSAKKLYVFMKPSGEYLIANHTGE